MKKKVLIFIVCYYAERFIQEVLDRIPRSFLGNDLYDLEVLIIDDASSDGTFIKAYEYSCDCPNLRINVLYNPQNQGYGGNQKLGYYYAIQNHFDAVVLIHGDGQYPPELLEQMVRPILDDEADVVLGSRMVHRMQALKGGMPLYKWIGNQVLTRLQNLILKSNLSEFHTGYRAYRVASLEKVPFQNNSNYFDFDTDILIQMLQTGQRITEIPIPTHYGEETSRVNGLRYACLILRTSLFAQIQKLGLYYDPRFDYQAANEHYTLKLGYNSSHQFAIDQVKPGARVLDIGCGPGYMARELAKLDAQVISIDRYILDLARQHSQATYEADVDDMEFSIVPPDIDLVFALDIIEHLRSPEKFLRNLRDHFGQTRPQLVLTTGNVAFLPMRISLLMGKFNYGKRGILDLDHTRLFTFASLRRILEAAGYEIQLVKGIPAPFPLALEQKGLAKFFLFINQWLIRISKALFSYQIAVIARPKPTLTHLMDAAEAGRETQIQYYFDVRNPIQQQN